MDKYIYAIGRRKRATATVRLIKGKGEVKLNGKELTDIPAVLIQPLKIVGLEDKFALSAQVKGGGITGQLEAIRLAVARALVKYDETLKPTLRKSGLLTRDPREKERKKPGLKRARRAPQWSKR